MNQIAQFGPPSVTLAFAQSLNGSIAARTGLGTRLSGAESLQMTHGLRSRHDAILVGVDTVIIDNPSLTTRLVNGPNPQPVVLDTHLRIPLTSNLIQAPGKPVWVLCGALAEHAREVALVQAGARVIRVPLEANGRVDLARAINVLGAQGITALMIEGGAQVIRTTLKQRLAQHLVLTIAPIWLGGIRPIEEGNGWPTLHNVRVQQLGDDVLLEADMESA